MKIAIIGYSGAGKSTMARKLSSLLNVPALHLDTVHWLPGWHERDDYEAETDIQAFMHQPSWIIEGNYMNLLRAERMSQADMILMLDLPRLTCLYRAFKRFRVYQGQSRPDMGPECPEKFDGEFVRWLLIDGRSKKRRRQFEQIANQYKAKTVILKSQREISRFIQRYETSSNDLVVEKI